MKFVSVAVAAAAFAVASHAALAAPADYRFEVVGQVRQDDGTDTIRVRLVHIPDGKPVQGAVVFGPKASMGGHGMAMTAPAKALPPMPDGVTPIQVTPSMDGPWTVSLSARVNGEPAVIRGAVDVRLGK
ncbi:FixH family protein [Rhodovastum atsumiense]|nr:FixH family protein [Rhodovastum atsumiense]